MVNLRSSYTVWKSPDWKKSPMAHGTLDFEKGFLLDTQLLEDISEEAVQFLHLSICSKVRIALTVLAQTTAERHQDKDEAILKSAAVSSVSIISRSVWTPGKRDGFPKSFGFLGTDWTSVDGNWRSFWGPWESWPQLYPRSQVLYLQPSDVYCQNALLKGASKTISQTLDLKQQPTSCMQYSSILWDCTWFHHFFENLWDLSLKKRSRILRILGNLRNLQWSICHLLFATTGLNLIEQQRQDLALRESSPWGTRGTSWPAWLHVKQQQQQQEVWYRKKGRNYIPENHGSSKDQTWPFHFFF